MAGPAACEWCARIVVVVLSPQVVAIVVSFKAARDAIAHVAGQLLPTRIVLIVAGRAARLPIRSSRKQPFKNALSQSRITREHRIILPEPRVSKYIPSKPHIAFSTSNAHAADSNEYPCSDLISLLHQEIPAKGG